MLSDNNIMTYVHQCVGALALFHLSQKPTRKFAAKTFIQSQYLKALTASLRVGFCDEWKRGLSVGECNRHNLHRTDDIKQHGNNRKNIEKNFKVLRKCRGESSIVYSMKYCKKSLNDTSFVSKNTKC